MGGSQSPDRPGGLAKTGWPDKPSSRRTATEPPQPLALPGLADERSRFLRLECEVEEEYRPQMLAALQRKVDAVAEEAGNQAPACPQCGQPMGHHDTRGWLAGELGTLTVMAPRYRCLPCHQESRPLLDFGSAVRGTGEHPRFAGPPAALLAVAGPYDLAVHRAAISRARCDHGSPRIRLDEGVQQGPRSRPQSG